MDADCAYDWEEKKFFIYITFPLKEWKYIKDQQFKKTRAHIAYGMDTEKERLLGDLVPDCQPLKRWGVFLFLSAVQGHVAG